MAPSGALGVSSSATLVWDERVLIDWEAGMRAAVHHWRGPQAPPLDSEFLARALHRAEMGARASGPESFLELVRRVYLALAQDLAFAPRSLDLLDLESRLRDLLPRPSAAARLRALRVHGFRHLWLQESESEIACAWRARVGEPFDGIVQVGPSSSWPQALAAELREAGEEARILVCAPIRDGQGWEEWPQPRLCWPRPEGESMQESLRGVWDKRWVQRLSDAWVLPGSPRAE